MNVTGLSSLIANTSPVAGVIISVALMLFSGFAMTRLTKLARLPNVTGYILAGILIGPYVLNLVPQRIIDGTDFLSDIALAFIAFSTGEFFKLSVLKKSGMKVVWITIFEAVLASVFIFILTFLVLRLELAFSIVLSALASATAPASTMMTIRQTGAKGDFVDTLLQVVALDDVVGLVLYSIAISVALASLSGASGFSFETLGKPVLLNLLVLVLRKSCSYVERERFNSDIGIAVAFMRRNYQEEISLPKLARLANLSESSFFRKFREEMKTSPMQWLLNLRIRKAMEFLIRSDMNIGEIAAATGFSDSLYFSRQFRRQVGVSPKNYRSQAHGPRQIIHGLQTLEEIGDI